MKQKKYYTPNTEKWKYTKINQFDSYSFDFKPTNSKVKIHCENNEIILQNGILNNIGLNLVDKQIIISNINDSNNHAQNIQNKLSINEDVKFNNKNINFYTGLFLYIPKNINENISIKNIIDQGHEKRFLNLKNYIYIDENSKSNITYNEETTCSSCIYNSYQLYVGNNSELEFTNINNRIDGSKAINNYDINIQANSKMTYHAMDISGKLIKNNYNINLNKAGANCYFNGLNIASQKNYTDNYIEIRHNTNHTFSDINYNIIAQDKSQSIFFAKTIINEKSSSCEAYQNNKNIILSEKALIQSNPQLEIYNDDVKCAHGSTTGQIDEEAVHYMRTRGINEILAKQLILHSFLADIINKISLKNLKTKLNNKIENYLKNVN
tara:strand:+ start:1426 stop:2568 length:1143 start_codon:yes stop_codon:yes gene_type:complete